MHLLHYDPVRPIYIRDAGTPAIDQLKSIRPRRYGRSVIGRVVNVQRGGFSVVHSGLLLAPFHGGGLADGIIRFPATDMTIVCQAAIRCQAKNAKNQNIFWGRRGVLGSGIRAG